MHTIQQIQDANFLKTILYKTISYTFFSDMILNTCLSGNFKV